MTSKQPEAAQELRQRAEEGMRSEIVSRNYIGEK